MEVKQNARPARHDDPTVPSTPVNGRESKRPINGQTAKGSVLFWFEVVLLVGTSAYIASRSGFVISRDLLPLDRRTAHINAGHPRTRILHRAFILVPPTSALRF